MTEVCNSTNSLSLQIRNETMQGLKNHQIAPVNSLYWVTENINIYCSWL